MESLYSFEPGEIEGDGCADRSGRWLHTAEVAVKIVPRTSTAADCHTSRNIGVRSGTLSDKEAETESTMDLQARCQGQIETHQHILNKVGLQLLGEEFIDPKPPFEPTLANKNNEVICGAIVGPLRSPLTVQVGDLEPTADETIGLGLSGLPLVPQYEEPTLHNGGKLPASQIDTIDPVLSPSLSVNNDKDCDTFVPSTLIPQPRDKA